MVKQRSKNPHEQQVYRVRLPRNREVIGVVEERLGGSRVRVRCLDGKTRVCRIPGRLRKSLWVRTGDTVIVEPWEYGGDKKGDVVFKYRRSEIQYLSNKGYLKGLGEFEEF